MLAPEIIDAIKDICRGQVNPGADMAEYCSLKAGGRAAAVAFPPGRDELEVLVSFLRGKRVPYLPFGRGTNLLVKDGGYPGVFISLAEGFSRVEHEREEGSGHFRIRAEGGAPLSRVVELAAEKGGAGLAPLTGIPGTVGGALRMNAGPAGTKGQVGESVKSALILESTGRVTTWDREDLEFGYRTSSLRERDFVLEAILELKPGAPEKIRKEMEAIREKKKSSQPWDLPNAGSIFKNPERGKAGEMIEEAGLKGVRIRGAQVSPVHANFIVNVGGATARDILSLAGMIRDRVKEKFGVLLEMELKVVGED